MKLSSLGIFFLMMSSTVTVARELHSYAIVKEDASLSISGKRVHLYGVYLPDNGKKCRSSINPPRCGSQASLALDFRIQGFVHCFPKSKNADGSLNAICYVDRGRFDEGEDLAAYLLKRGLALALPDAPFKYQALERIARSQELGVWGYSGGW